MTTGKYEYLRKYIDYKLSSNEDAYPNCFRAVSEDQIKDMEERLGFKFPESLKEFWLEIGCGSLDTSSKGVKSIDFFNTIHGPQEIADIMLLKEECEYLVLDGDYEDRFEEDEIPFFEICDSSSFLIMKKGSEFVYDTTGAIIERKFERFIWRLYYESPTFYLHV